ncbi:M15 family metallopeptidase [Pseudoxanthomonas sacheonensis]|uniref:M15 family metallopeptidase n=1 Tax=Pseudoxanthomonas sacheonensis TaxID=443615 RepID=UPI00286B2A32|nr:M15 family metallopeptidase [Pseudoxanthomonas sacheonensis]
MKTWPSNGYAVVSEPGRRALRGAVLLAWIALACASCASVPTPSPASSPELSTARTFAEAGLVDIRTLVPDISQQIRYAGSENFVGVPVEGYNAARCYLREPAAQALQRVEQSLRREGFRLRVFDCYRPARAVRHFVRWAADLQDQRTKTRYYPNLDKTQLLGDYIAPVSGHSRGATLDLTLLDCRGADNRCLPLDMGTEFDFFDTLANTDSPRITQAQRDNRQRLLRAMTQQGFRNYPMEWWHYTLASEDPPLYDIPIE